MIMNICPICLKEYPECTCGFEKLKESSPEDEVLFQIFKYTKNVFLNRIPYTPSTIEILYNDEGKNYIDIISPYRGLEFVEHEGVVCNGVLAFATNTKALILNCDYADGEFLDESRLRILFLGKDFKGFVGEPLHLNKIKYLYVHKDNLYFESENNMLKRKSG